MIKIKNKKIKKKYKKDKTITIKRRKLSQNTSFTTPRDITAKKSRRKAKESLLKKPERGSAQTAHSKKMHCFIIHTH